eukprot:1569766-Rhodomonas_salina.7
MRRVGSYALSVPDTAYEARRAVAEQTSALETVDFKAPTVFADVQNGHLEAAQSQCARVKKSEHRASTHA